MAKIYEDSKTFVDMKMKQPPNETMEKFLVFMNETNNAPTKSQVRGFVNDTFEPAGQEFEDWIPSDWIPHPKFVDNIADENFRSWALQLNEIWKSLGRKMKNTVKQEEELYSIIWVPNPVVVPGGRFREFYYWDSYWIVQGLLLSEMEDTVRGMLENFLYIVDKYGHIPNGGRIYYNARSQPPLLIPMMKLYFEHTKDLQFIANHIKTMENEYNYWFNNHRTEIDFDGKKVNVAYYGDKSNGPRPESYSEDIDSAASFKEQQKKEEFYSHLKAAAESGWDFSSRYFITNGTNKGKYRMYITKWIFLHKIFRINSIIPKRDYSFPYQKRTKFSNKKNVTLFAINCNKQLLRKMTHFHLLYIYKNVDLLVSKMYSIAINYANSA